MYSAVISFKNCILTYNIVSRILIAVSYNVYMKQVLKFLHQNIWNKCWTNFNNKTERSWIQEETVEIRQSCIKIHHKYTPVENLKHNDLYIKRLQIKSFDKEKWLQFAILVLGKINENE